MENARKAFIDFMLSPNNPIGKVSHYFCRREYQGRGMQHFHFAIWVENAPIIGENTNEEVVEFITKYVTCQIPDKDIAPILHERVMKYQQHRCNAYCLRAKKTKSGVRKVCRFGFPRPQSDKVCLRSVIEAVAGRKALKPNSRLYDLPRTSKERMTNDYNPSTLLVWNGNTDIQYIGEKSAILNWYITKYTTKAEKAHSNTAFTEITSTKSLASRLWNIALRSISHRECGAMEVSDTLLGLPLYETDVNTVFRWVDVNQLRSRRVKEYGAIRDLPADSDDLFYPSWIDTYYPNRPAELDSLNLYDFLAWYDMVDKQPSEAFLYYPFFNRFLKKRTRPYLINHFRYNPKQDAEKYFYSILLLFKPWRQCDTLLGDSSNYVEAFNECKTSLLDALQYHDQLSHLQEADSTVRDLIRERLDEMKKEDLNNSDDSTAGPLRYVATAVNDVMDDFEELRVCVNPSSVDNMIKLMNADQSRVFQTVKTVIEAQSTATTTTDTEILRLFVSGCGGTGKSFLINTIRAWVQTATGKDVAVAAPTGIASRNINGLTIHGILVLPVEHGSTPPYKPMSDDALKIVREKLRNVTLLIVDEVSMVSNVMLLYMHLRLQEIFQTEENDNGWFGGKNILVLGDLLQLPPVFEGPVYAPMSADLTAKLTGCVGTINLWRKLFTYDELTINMRQKDDADFSSMLSRVRVGFMTDEDVDQLEKRKISFSSDTVTGRLEEVAKTMQNLPSDTVCLLPTRHMCEQLNNCMLKELPGEEIHLSSIDSVDCPVHLRNKVSKKLNQYSEDSSLTAGLEKLIIIKIGCKIILRRNIDISLGLVNGAIGTITSVKYSIDERNVVDSITIKFDNGKHHVLEKVNSKFQILDKAFVIRRQFPISHAYAITIHKSQGLTLNNVLVDLGNSIFACGQAYVAMSRVTSLSGLHLINFDPRSIKALDSAIVEYCYLRETFRPTLPSLKSHKGRPKGVADRQWCVQKLTALIQQQCIDSAPGTLTVLPRKGFVDPNGCSSYSNSVMQCLLHSKVVRNVLRDSSIGCLMRLVNNYEDETDSALDTTDIRMHLGDPFSQSVTQDPACFLQAVSAYCPSLSSILFHKAVTDTWCDTCESRTSSTDERFFIHIKISEDCKSVKMADLIANCSEYHLDKSLLCDKCHRPLNVRTQVVDAKQILILKLDVWSKNTDGNDIRRKANISAVPSSSIKVGDKTFTLRSSIHLSSTKGAGVSYVSVVLSNNKWVHCNNQTLSTQSWPKGAKNLYIAFYENTSMCNAKSRPRAPKTLVTKPSCKRKISYVEDTVCLAKRPCSEEVAVPTTSMPQDWGGVTGYEGALIRTEWPEYRYYPVDTTWQQDTCRLLGLRFVKPFNCVPGGPGVILTRPDKSSLVRIGGDGNCLFRALCCIITGSEIQHFELRSAIVAHMLAIPHLLCGLGSDGHGNYLYRRHDNVESYLSASCMANNGTWGTDVELCVLAHLVNAVVYNFNSSGYWIAFFPHGIDRSIPENVTSKSLYIYNIHRLHFDVVTNICR